jgi:hypothetical protein
MPAKPFVDGLIGDEHRPEDRCSSPGSEIATGYTEPSVRRAFGDPADSPHRLAKATSVDAKPASVFLRQAAGAMATTALRRTPVGNRLQGAVWACRGTLIQIKARRQATD